MLGWALRLDTVTQVEHLRAKLQMMDRITSKQRQVLDESDIEIVLPGQPEDIAAGRCHVTCSGVPGQLCALATAMLGKKACAGILSIEY